MGNIPSSYFIQFENKSFSLKKKKRKKYKSENLIFRPDFSSLIPYMTKISNQFSNVVIFSSEQIVNWENYNKSSSLPNSKVLIKLGFE
jgi:hypothetical protein